jgi:hypothetical protein
MEATLRESPGPELKKTETTKSTPALRARDAHTATADATIPLRFVLAGIVALATGLAGIAFHPDLLLQYHYSPQIIAFTHWIVIGFIATMVMGASYQLAPVALETTLHSEKLARLHFWLHIIGFPGMVWTFWIWNPKQLGHFGSAFGLGVLLWAYNLFRTLRRVPRWNPVAFGLASACGWLVITMLAGLYLASAKCWPKISLFGPIAQMHAHAHLGLLGCFIIVIAGVSYRLIPMFAMTEVQSTRRAWWSLILLNLAVVGIVVTVALESSWRPAASALGLAGVTLYLIEVRAMLAERRRASLDWGLKMFVTAVALLLPAALLGFALGFPGFSANEFTGRLETVYGLLGIFGVIVPAILGMLYKIVPFLVWFHTYRGTLGRTKAPALTEMYHHGLQKIGYWSYFGGLAGTILGVASGRQLLTTVAWAVIAASMSTFLVNLVLIGRHWFRAQAPPAV